MSRRLLVPLLAALILAGPAFAEGPFTAVPSEALALLAQSKLEGCSSCARKLRNKAFQILDAALRPGLVVSEPSGCSWARPNDLDKSGLVLTCYPALFSSGKDAGTVTAYPELIFQYHTRDKHLAGVDSEYYTEPDALKLLYASPLGTVFSGTIKIIPYPYGDGPCYNYESSFNRLVIHCQVQGLAPTEKK